MFHRAPGTWSIAHLEHSAHDGRKATELSFGEAGGDELSFGDPGVDMSLRR